MPSDSKTDGTMLFCRTLRWAIGYRSSKGGRFAPLSAIQQLWAFLDTAADQTRKLARLDALSMCVAPPMLS